MLEQMLFLLRGAKGGGDDLRGYVVNHLSYLRVALAMYLLLL